MIVGLTYTYLAIGVLNYLHFAARGNAMLFIAGSRIEGVIEALFFVLLWPIQLGYWILGKIEDLAAAAKR